MVDKKQVRQNLGRLQRIKTWQLVVLLILVCFVSATFLRLNNIGMVERREAVSRADKAGDNKITQTRLYDLQRYVSAHMNTDMSKGVYLEEAYKRDQQLLFSKATIGPNGNIYKKAQDVCAPQYSSWSTAYVQCTISELDKYPSGENLNKIVILPNSSYLHVYASPLWSPDFAGWSVVVCVVILIMIFSRFIGVIILKVLLRKHKNRI
jgi:hypothetical protein